MKTTAIILAAGMGNRLKEHTKNTPKALVEINGRSFLDYAIENARASGANEIIVVGGYLFSQTKAALSNEATLVENTDYALQNLVTFKCGLESFPEARNLLVVNYDYIFHPHSTSAMKENSKGFSIFCSYDLSGDAEDVMNVRVDGEGNMIEMSKTLKEFNAIYNGFWFVDAKLIPLLREVTEHLYKTVDLKTTAVEEIFREFVRRGEKIKVADIGKADWMEIDTPEELEIARARIGEYYPRK